MILENTPAAQSSSERTDVVARLLGGVVVSSQTHRAGGPMDDPDVLVRMALSAGLGGARGYRVASPLVVARLRRQTSLPIIGLTKVHADGFSVYITPSVADVVALIDAGADIVAADCAPESRPADPFSELVTACHSHNVPIMADCATVDQALMALGQGADIVATTMAGFTIGTAHIVPPDMDMLTQLRARVSAPIALEGGVWTPHDVQLAFAAGASFVVVGSAVTDPERITARLVAAAPPAS